MIVFPTRVIASTAVESEDRVNPRKTRTTGHLKRGFSLRTGLPEHRTRSELSHTFGYRCLLCHRFRGRWGSGGQGDRGSLSGVMPVEPFLLVKLEFAALVSEKSKTFLSSLSIEATMSIMRFVGSLLLTSLGTIRTTSSYRAG